MARQKAVPGAVQRHRPRDSSIAAAAAATAFVLMTSFRRKSRLNAAASVHPDRTKRPIDR